MYWQAYDIEDLAKKVMIEYGDVAHLRDPQCRIAYQHCDFQKKSHGKLVLADTELVKEKIKVFMPYDFLMTVYDGSCAGLDEERMKRLVYHELKHVGYEQGCGSDDPNKYYIIPHDYEDFKSVIDKWGPDWVRYDQT